MAAANYPAQITQFSVENAFVPAVALPIAASNINPTQINALQTVGGVAKTFTLTEGTWLVNGNGQLNFADACTGCEYMCATFDLNVLGGGRQTSAPICVGVGNVFTANTNVPFTISDLINVPAGTTKTFVFNITYTGLLTAPCSVSGGFVVATRIGNFPVSNPAF